MEFLDFRFHEIRRRILKHRAISRLTTEMTTRMLNHRLMKARKVRNRGKQRLQLQTLPTDRECTASVKVGLCEDVRGQALNFKESGFKSATLFRYNDLVIL